MLCIHNINWEMITAFASWALVLATIWLVSKQIGNSKRELQIKTQLIYEEKFDSKQMIYERNKLATQIKNNVAHKEIQETVLNLFESIGLLLRKKSLNPEMVWATFSYYAIRWYSACKEYIKDEQKLNDNDTTIFGDFEYLVNEMCKIETAKRKNPDIILTKEDITRFLNDEINLS